MNLVRSVAFRSALWITLIALLTTAAALTVQFLQTTRLLDARTQAILDEEAVGLLDRYQSGGPLSVAASIQRQQQQPRLNGVFYVLADPFGRIVVGDLPVWPAGLSASGRSTIRLTLAEPSGRQFSRMADTLTLALPDRHRLLVGRLAEDQAVIRAQYGRSLIWSLLLTLCLGLTLGWWFGRRSLRFMGEVSETGRRFLRGQLEERVALSNRNDEYDELALTMNACFDEIEHVVRSLRAATDGLAHDLKTPLSRLRSRLELAEMRKLDDGELRAVVDATRRDLDALLTIIRDVLEVAKAEAATPDSFAAVDLAEVVDDVIQLYTPVAEERSIQLDASLAKGLVHGSRPLLAQLVANLVDNAIKFSPERSRISVSIASAADSTRLTVADEGSGIPPERRDEALARFGRLDPSRHENGIGLGLSIVRAVARVHRADLRLEDNSPGLRVVVGFPKFKPPHP